MMNRPNELQPTPESMAKPEDDVDILSSLHKREAKLGYWNWNLATNETNWSPGCYRIFGYTPGQCLSSYEAFQARLHPDDREAVIRALYDAIDRNTPFQMDYRVIWLDGTIHEVHSEADIPLTDPAGKPVMLFGMVREITGCTEVGAKLPHQADLVEYVSEPVIATDSNFIIRSWNQAAEKAYGWAAVEAIGKNADQLLKTRFIDRSHEETYRQLLEQGRIETGVLLESKDGRVLNAHSTVSLIKDHRGAMTGTVRTMQDITERKKMEMSFTANLTELSQILVTIETTLNTIPIGVVAAEAGTERVVYYNPGAKVIIGVPVTSFVTGPVPGYPESITLFRPDGSEISPDDWPLARALRRGMITFEEEIILRHISGKEVTTLINCTPVSDENGRILWAIASIIDITERKRVEKALSESEERMRAVYEQAAMGINQVGLDGGYININQKFCDMSGYTKDELLDLTIRDMHPPGDYQWEQERMQKLLSGDISTYTGEMQCICKNGNWLWVNVAGSLVKNGSNPAYFIRIVEDVSYRKKMEEALQHKQDELAASNEELRVRQEELTAANEELQTQQEELIVINEALQAQTEKLNTAYQELQCQSAEIRKYWEIAIRARNQAEQRAAELDAIISSIAAGVIIYDHLGNIFRMNEIARNVFGYPSQDYNGPYRDTRAGINLYKADGIPLKAEETPLYRALRGEIIRDEEIMITGVPGEPVWLSETLAPIFDQNHTLIGVIFVFTDITIRKRQVEDLLASERELLKVTLNSLGEGVITVDSDGHIILINESAANLTGYSPAEATGQPIHKILYVCDDKTSEPIMINASPKISGKPILVTRDLREVPVAVNSSPIKTMDGRSIGTVIVFQDISEKQKTERELLKAEKLESLGILAGGIAHDFNNILAAILSNIQLALRKMEKNEDIRKYLLNTEETTRKASDLTKQLLTFSKGGDPVKKDASLIELIRDTTEFVLRGANVKAEFAIPDDLWVASIDEGQISQVIYNLVINAKQAMPRGGVIHISAENVVIGGDSRYIPGDYVKIAVSDQGGGISKENFSKIFDPFFTTKKDGNGLGLATSYSIISRHNGYLEAESKEGYGTTFFIYLPASGTLVAKDEPKKEIAASGVGFKILFMDDEEKILNAVGEMLNYSFGYQVVLVTDGAKAIELYKRAKESGEPFDVVIMDLTVPGGMGGQEAIAHLRDFDPNVKAIVSSGYANDPVIADFERYGFHGVVSKPYKIDELNEVLQQVVNPAQLPLKLTFE
jgi:PAS domain S-box-containing protein